MVVTATHSCAAARLSVNGCHLVVQRSCQFTAVITATWRPTTSFRHSGAADTRRPFRRSGAARSHRRHSMRWGSMQRQHFGAAAHRIVWCSGATTTSKRAGSGNCHAACLARDDTNVCWCSQIVRGPDNVSGFHSGDRALPSWSRVPILRLAVAGQQRATTCRHTQSRLAV